MLSLKYIEKSALPNKCFFGHILVYIYWVKDEFSETLEKNGFEFSYICLLLVKLLNFNELKGFMESILDYLYFIVNKQVLCFGRFLVSQLTF